MNISVIIPVFNAAVFLEKAVYSALEQSVVAEVVLIEDGSTDNSLEKASALEEKHAKVCLFQHPDKCNHGPGASRNLGIQKAQYPFIAFLDADDFYLPQRFLMTQAVFEQKKDAEGVYEAIGVHFYNKASEADYKNLSPYELTTVRQKKLSPDELPFYIIGQPGHQFSLDGLTVRKKTIEQIGGFDETLKQVQDTDFIWKLCLNARLYPGQIEQAVSKRGVHGGNSIFRTEKVLYYRLEFAKKWLDKIPLMHWDKRINRAVFRTYLEALAQQEKINSRTKKIWFKLIKSLLLLKKPLLIIRLLI